MVIWRRYIGIPYIAKLFNTHVTFWGDIRIVESRSGFTPIATDILLTVYLSLLYRIYDKQGAAGKPDGS
jgi:hypothetical protein